MLFRLFLNIYSLITNYFFITIIIFYDSFLKIILWFENYANLDMFSKY